MEKIITEKKERLKEIDKILLKPDIIQDRKRYADILRERSEIEEILNLYEEYKRITKEIEDTKDLLKDEEMKEMAEAELEKLNSRLEKIKSEISSHLVEKDPLDEKDVFMEIRAGTGGEESAIFAGDLFRMYQRYCERNNWKISIVDSHSSDLKGFKEVIFQIRGNKVYSKLKYEKGIHRVQRVPVTESSGRIHTSAVSVVVLPEIEEKEVYIDNKDLKIDVFRASGHGGQYVNTTDSAVRITHIPTGIVVTCQDERSQHQNKAKAMQILRARLYEKQQMELQKEISDNRKKQIGTGDRSEKIRTYNFPQNRVTDHRINLTLYKLDKILDGELDELIEALSLKLGDNTQSF